MKKLFPIIAIFFTLISCTKQFLKKDFISKLTYPESEENSIIYYNKLYTVSEKGKLYIKTHRILKVGQNLKAAPEFLYVHDGSIERLKHFSGRLIKKDGSVKSYGQGDLHEVNLSNRAWIADLKIRFLPIPDVVGKGDFIETVSIHEHVLPALGIRFSLSELEYESSNVFCTIQIPSIDSLLYEVGNDSIFPEVSVSGKYKEYVFEWKNFKPDMSGSIFSKKNRDPEILAVLPRIKIDDDSPERILRSWIDFGDWYLNLIQPKTQISKEIALLAERIVQNKTDDKSKIDAIFEYCQKNIRYEQVYLEKGEIIPNDCETIFARKFGDCKDYSILIYSMAKHVGLTPNLALCYRGRNFVLNESLSVSQFNHMILHYNDGENNYWYDGTNRAGLPGLTSFDLVNQKALILQKSKSRILEISECNQNKLSIAGSFHVKEKGLKGNLKISLGHQYAIDFFYMELFLNNVDMKHYLIDWLHENINQNIAIKKLNWYKDEKHFFIETDCELPNTVLLIKPHVYLSLGRIFNSFIPVKSTDMDTEKIFYYPSYNRVEIDLYLADLTDLNGKLVNNEQGVRWTYNYALPLGPFKESVRSDFIRQYQTVSQELNNNQKFQMR